MIAALRLAELSALIYADTTSWLNYWQTNDVVIGHVKEGDIDILVLRGSVTAKDWMLDASAVPVWHEQLGFVHAGFLAGIDDVFAEVRNVVGQKVAITGHSLGGARARILAALFAVNGPGRVVQLCTFGSPKPAFVNLARIIQKAIPNHSSYRNRNDIVPTVPLSFPPFLDFVHTEDWIALDAAPAEDDLQALRDHSSALYVKALTP